VNVHCFIYLFIYFFVTDFLPLPPQQAPRYFEGDVPDAAPDAQADGRRWVHPVKEMSDLHPERPMTLFKGPHSLLRALAKKYRLNKTEYLQLYNLRPRTRITLDLIIEEVSAWLGRGERGRWW